MLRRIICDRILETRDVYITHAALNDLASGTIPFEHNYHGSSIFRLMASLAMATGGQYLVRSALTKWMVDKNLVTVIDDISKDPEMASGATQALAANLDLLMSGVSSNESAAQVRNAIMMILEGWPRIALESDKGKGDSDEPTTTYTRGAAATKNLLAQPQKVIRTYEIGDTLRRKLFFLDRITDMLSYVTGVTPSSLYESHLELIEMSKTIRDSAVGPNRLSFLNDIPHDHFPRLARYMYSTRNRSFERDVSMSEGVSLFNALQAASISNSTFCGSDLASLIAIFNISLNQDDPLLSFAFGNLAASNALTIREPNLLEFKKALSICQGSGDYNKTYTRAELLCALGAIKHGTPGMDVSAIGELHLFLTMEGSAAANVRFPKVTTAAVDPKNVASLIVDLNKCRAILRSLYLINIYTKQPDIKIDYASPVISYFSGSQSTVTMAEDMGEVMSGYNIAHAADLMAINTLISVAMMYTPTDIPEIDMKNSKRDIYALRVPKMRPDQYARGITEFGSTLPADIDLSDYPILPFSKADEPITYSTFEDFPFHAESELFSLPNILPRNIDTYIRAIDSVDGEEAAGGGKPKPIELIRFLSENKKAKLRIGFDKPFPWNGGDEPSDARGLAATLASDEYRTATEGRAESPGDQVTAGPYPLFSYLRSAEAAFFMRYGQVIAHKENVFRDAYDSVAEYHGKPMIEHISSVAMTLGLTGPTIGPVEMSPTTIAETMIEGLRPSNAFFRFANVAFRLSSGDGDTGEKRYGMEIAGKEKLDNLLAAINRTSIYTTGMSHRIHWIVSTINTPAATLKVRTLIDRLARVLYLDDTDRLIDDSREIFDKERPSDSKLTIDEALSKINHAKKATEVITTSRLSVMLSGALAYTIDSTPVKEAEMSIYDLKRGLDNGPGNDLITIDYKGVNGKATETTVFHNPNVDLGYYMNNALVKFFRTPMSETILALGYETNTSWQGYNALKKESSEDPARTKKMRDLEVHIAMLLRQYKAAILEACGIMGSIDTFHLHTRFSTHHLFGVFYSLTATILPRVRRGYLVRIPGVIDFAHLNHVVRVTTRPEHMFELLTVPDYNLALDGQLPIATVLGATAIEWSAPVVITGIVIPYGRRVELTPVLFESTTRANDKKLALTKGLISLLGNFIDDELDAANGRELLDSSTHEPGGATKARSVFSVARNRPTKGPGTTSKNEGASTTAPSGGTPVSDSDVSQPSPEE
jgi:hypothetical protein